MVRLYRVLMCVCVLCSWMACTSEEGSSPEVVRGGESMLEGEALSADLEASLKQQSGGKSDTAELAPGVFISGVPSTQFELASGPDAQGKQRKDLWCWAATMQMVLNFHGVDVLQEDIVYRAFGDLRNQPASSTPQIADVVRGWTFSDRVGDAWALDAVGVKQVDLIPMIEDLHFNSPLIVALANEPGATGGSGHAYVLSAITYQVDARGLVYPLSVDLRDPWPDNPSHSKITWQEFMSRYWGHVRVRAYAL